MDLLERVKKICLTPQTEWPVIAGETTPPATLITSYVLPLAVVGAVAGFIGGSLVGLSVPLVGTYRTPLVAGLGLAVFSVVMAVVGVVVLAFIINALAPTFGAEKNTAQAFKVAVYSVTPAWVAGVFQILPALGILALLGALYGLYLLYLGLPRLMKSPPDKAMSYTAVVVVCAVVLSLVMTVVGGMFAGVGRLGTAGLTGALGGGETAADEQVDPNTPLGRLQQLGQELEKSAQTAEAAAKSGDPGAQATAAIEGLGALFGGGRRVDPLDIEQLKPFVPETFAGLPRTSNSAEKTSVGIMVVSKAEATYGDGAQKNVTLEVLDAGGASGLIGLASWANVQSEKEDDDGVERTQRVGGRLVHEKISKRGTNEFSIVLGDRFVETRRGTASTSTRSRRLCRVSISAGSNR